MKVWLLVCAFLAIWVCLVSAKRGSISNGLFHEDVNDDPPANGAEEEQEDVPREKFRENPCNKKKCTRGQMCRLTEDKQAECVCRDDCERYRKEGDRYKVCSNTNDTFLSECDLDREHCLCKHKSEDCTMPDAKKIYLDYYGNCKEMEECTELQLSQFPRRMRNWLLVVMEFLEQHHRLEGGYHDLLTEAKEDTDHQAAAVWKFCDLDLDPQDRSVSRRELQYTVRSLRYVENCLVTFLDECDADNDREITLPEWGQCLGVDHEHINDRCIKIKEKRKKTKQE